VSARLALIAGMLSGLLVLGACLGALHWLLLPERFPVTGVELKGTLKNTSAAEIRAALPRAGLPVIVVHGLEDGLVPPAFSSAPYVAAAQAAGREVRYWQVHNAEHFDAFLGFPDYAARFVPMLPYVYAALDRVDAFLDGKGALPTDAVIATTPRGSAELGAGNLAIPH